MKNVKTTLRARLIAAVAAFGFTAIGGSAAASAHEGHGTGATVQVKHTVSAGASARARVATGYWQRSGNGYVWRETPPTAQRSHYTVTRVRPGVYRYDIDRDGRLDHFEIDYRRYDANRNGVLEATERQKYWSHMADMGIFGELTKEEIGRIGQLGYIFDTNGDGRMIGRELRGVNLLIDSMRAFEEFDRNGDRVLVGGEMRRAGHDSGGLIHPRAMDMNGDRKLSYQEVRDSVLAAYRAGRV